MEFDYKNNSIIHIKEDLWLEYTEEGLMLTDGSLKLTGDFSRLLPRLKQSNLEQELLIKAVRIKGAGENIRVLDATAGLGEDSLILAAAGFRVKLLEYDPVISVLLKDSLERAEGLTELKQTAERMDFLEADSVRWMQETAGREHFDVIFLDPMFPEREKSALIKKKFQLLQRLEQPCPADAQEKLLEAALSMSPKKIVVKRPLKGEVLAGRKPSYSLKGKAIRYDCIVL